MNIRSSDRISRRTTHAGLFPALALLAAFAGQAMAQMPTPEQMAEMQRAMGQYNSPEMQAKIAAAQQAMGNIDACQTLDGTGLLVPHPELERAAGGLVNRNCVGHAKFKEFCAKVQEHPDTFASLYDDEIRAGGLLPRGAARGGIPTLQQVQRAPLTETMSACGLATDDASYRKLQSRLAARAMTEAAKVNVEEEAPAGDARAWAWKFALRFATDEYYDKAAALARQECQGANGFWGSKQKMHFRFCDTLGDAMDGFDMSQRGRVLQRWAGCEKRTENRARGTCVGVGDVADAALPAQAAPAAGSAEPEKQVEEKKDTGKPKDALKKGKDKLKGLFGG